MKRIAKAIIGTIALTLALSGCVRRIYIKTDSNGNTYTTVDPTSNGDIPNPGRILSDDDSYGWCLHGEFMLESYGEINSWGGKENYLYEYSMMTPISINHAKEIDYDVGVALSRKNVRHLYMYEGAAFGINDAGWYANFVEDGQVYRANGSYVFKASKVMYDSYDRRYYTDQWMPDPYNSNVEALTSNLFLPPWQEENDEYGFNWGYNPVVTGGAGVYTVIVAEYNVYHPYYAPNFGIALIKNYSLTGYDYEAASSVFNPLEHTYGLIGSFNNWNGDYAMSRGQDYYWWAGINLQSYDNVKIRADGNWGNSWGYEYVNIPSSTPYITDGGGNIQVQRDGYYEFLISFANSTPEIFIYY